MPCQATRIVIGEVSEGEGEGGLRLVAALNAVPARLPSAASEIGLTLTSTLTLTLTLTTDPSPNPNPNPNPHHSPLTLTLTLSKASEIGGVASLYGLRLGLGFGFAGLLGQARLDQRLVVRARPNRATM